MLAAAVWCLRADTNGLGWTVQDFGLRIQDLGLRYRMLEGGCDVGRTGQTRISGIWFRVYVCTCDVCVCACGYLCVPRFRVYSFRCRV